jgi:hypothetical protein
MAMMHLAVHDALNTIERRYEPYLCDVDRSFKRHYPAGIADPAPTANGAIATARDVLVGIITDWGKPEQRTKALAIIESAYTAALAELPEGLAKKHGVTVGQAAAAAMLSAHKGDGSSAPSRPPPCSPLFFWKRPSRVQHDQRGALRGHHAIVQEFRAGLTGERRLPRLRRHPLPFRLPGRDHAGRADRPARFAQYLQAYRK